MEIMGLPLHPLVIHAVVILVPLSALGGLVISVWGWARQRYSGLVVLGAGAAAASTYVAQEAGEALLATFSQPPAAVQTHAQLGDGLLLWAIILFFGVLAVWIARRMIEKNNPRGRIALIVGAAITVVSAVISIVQVVRIGHSGATAVWG